MQQEKTLAISYRRQNLQVLLILTVVWAIYILLMPVNRTENDDGYNYAWQLLHGSDAELYQSRFPLFLPLERLVYATLRTLNLHPDAYMTMVWVSSVFAIASLYLFFQLLRRRFLVTMTTSVQLMLLLAFSYGFWRYAVEAELYSFSHFLIFMSLYLLTSSSESRPVLLSGSLVASLAVLLYKPNFIPLFLAFPFYFLYLKRSRDMLLYLGSGAFFILSGYALIYFSVQVSQPTFLSYLFSGSDGNAGNPLMAFFVFLSDIGSSNYMYGFPQITGLIHSRFPGNMIVEEVLTASFYPLLNKIALLTSALLVAAGINLLIRRLRMSTITPRTPAQKTLLRVMWIWLLVYWIILSFLDPNSPEPWMMLVPPLFFILAFELVHAPESAGNSRAGRGLLVLVIVLAVHNLVAAVIPNLNRSSDYNKNQAAGLVAAATPKDVILCFGSYTEFYYLRYYAGARVINANEDLSGIEKEFEHTRKDKGRFFLTQDAVSPSEVIRFRNYRNLVLLRQFLHTHTLSLPTYSSASGTEAYYILYP